MESFLTDFHFLRPAWLLLIPLIVAFTYWLSRQGQHKTGFEHIIDKRLLQHLITRASEQRVSSQNDEPINSSVNRRPLPIYSLLATAWIGTCIALAGPTWQQLPQPLQKSDQALVIILDLSPSMRAQDNKPSRIVRARLKIKDLISQRRDGLTALIVYAGEAHVVTPLTDDINTIDNLLSTLEPGLLPIPGSNIEMALQTATQLTRDAAIREASYVILTDGIDPSAIDTLKDISDNTSHKQQLFIIGLGTPNGAPIPTPSNNHSSGFLRDSNNVVINAVRNDETLKQAASVTNGHYLPLQATDADIEFILESIDRTNPATSDHNRDTQRTMDQWNEFGPTLLLIFLPLLAFMFRRGWLLSLCIMVIPITLPETTYADDSENTSSQSSIWERLWLNDQQRGKQLFDQQQYEKAEALFDDSKTHQWKGSAAYKNKDYQTAVDAFSQGNTATDNYNRGNALSQLERFEEAIAAYDSALAKDPSLGDAEKNRQLVQQLLEQQQEQQDSENNGENNDNKESKDQNSQKQQGSKDKNSQDDNQANEQSDADSQQSQEDKKDSETNSNTDTANQQQEEQKENHRATKKDDDNTNNDQQQRSITAFDQLSDEEQQELEQWIQKIPDDPSGLLRRKFEYEFEKRRELYRSGQWQLPENNAHERY
ncbi:VWA domain-containing protein [Eionea flava]